MKKFSIKQKLTGYSAMAALLLTCTNKSDAQIIYKDIAPDDTLADNSSFTIDMDNDGIVDFKIADRYHPGQCHSSTVSIKGIQNNLFLGNDYASALNPGDLISESQEFWLEGEGTLWNFHYEAVGSSSAMSCIHPEHLGPWHGAYDKFIGVAFNNSTGKHYGWIRFSFPNIIKDCAFNSIADQPIHAGETGDCDTLQIHVDPIGPFAICNNGYVTLKASYITPSFYHSLNWDFDGEELPASSDTLNVSASGNYTAILSGFGCADSSNIVTINYENPPPPPTILLYNDSLFSSYPTSNQWYLNGNVIPGATGSYYAFTQTGVYAVKYVLPYGCSSLSDNYYFSYVATGLYSETDPRLNIKIENRHLTIVVNPDFTGSEISLYDVFGRLKYQLMTGSNIAVIDLSHFTAGIYICCVVKNDKYLVKEFFID